MGMTVAEFIEWLKTQPQDAIVTTISHSSGMDYCEQGGRIEVVNFNSEPSAPGKYDQTFELDDFTDEGYKKYPALYGRKELFIGSRDN